MFNQLVESGSHRTDLARRGTFFAGTMALYAVLLAGTGVLSVYAYDAQLSKENLEITYLTAVPLPEPPVRAPEHAPPPRASSGNNNNEVPTRATATANIDVPLMPTSISTTPSNVKPLPPGGAAITGVDHDPLGYGPLGPSNGLPSNGSAGVRVSVPDGADVPPPAPTPAPTPKPTPPSIQRLASNVISSKVISKPVPAYPIIAKQARVSGVVTVEILLDERGNVLSAQATSGHPLLREAARAAALQARFSPTQLNGQPVKVSGVITYNFVLQ
jgi:protein TonB